MDISKVPHKITHAKVKEWRRSSTIRWKVC